MHGTATPASQTKAKCCIIDLSFATNLVRPNHWRRFISRSLFRPPSNYPFPGFHSIGQVKVSPDEFKCLVDGGSPIHGSSNRLQLFDLIRQLVRLIRGPDSRSR